MFQINGRCNAGHSVTLHVDEDGLICQPDECPTCLDLERVSVQPGKLRLWLLHREMKRLERWGK